MEPQAQRAARARPGHSPGARRASQEAPDGWPLNTRWVRVGQLALTALVTWFILSRMGPGLDELRALDLEAWRPHPLFLGASCLVLLGGYFMSAAIWGRIVRDLGGPALPVGASVPLFMVANLGRYVPGKVWQIAGLAALARRKGVPVPVATAAAVVGQGVALLAASGLGALVLLQSPAPYPVWGLVAMGTLVAGLALASVPAVYARVLGAWFRLARADAPETLTRSDGLRWLALNVVNWVVYAGSFWLLTRSFGLEGPPLAIGSAFAAAYVLGYVMVFAPAGLGPREGFLIAFLAPWFGAGPAGVVAVIARLWTTAVEVLPAAGFWLGGVVAAEREARDG